MRLAFPHAMQDRDLLRAYVLNHSEPAFAELVARHINLVYAAARRVVVDADLAKDVTQDVFIDFARKAETIRDGDALPGWLYRAACHRAVSAVRSEHRRHERETAAMSLAALETAGPAEWVAIAPLLEEAMQRLNSNEQDAVVLRYFEGKNLREVGLALGWSDDTAQKRISRALDKMKLYFNRRGVTTTAAVLAALLVAHSARAAPAGLAVNITGKALAGAGVAGTVAKVWSVKKALVVLALTVLAGVATVTAWHLEVASAERAPANAIGGVVAGEQGDTPDAIALEAPLNPGAAGEPLQFVLSSLRTDHGTTVTVRADGTLSPIPDASADVTPQGYLLTYRISLQEFHTPATTAGDEAVSSRDDFEIYSTATLSPNTPFQLLRANGKNVSLQTDGKKIVLTITRPAHE